METSTTDKAVSTEDLCAKKLEPSVASGVARLEAILHTLVETKVEALKNDSRKTSSAHSSPKSILNRLRLTSTSSQSTKGDESEKDRVAPSRLAGDQSHVVDMKVLKKSVIKQDILVLSSGHCKVHSYDLSSNSEDERHRSMNHNDNIYFDDSCPPLLEEPQNCYCNRDSNRQIMSFDDDYISIKVDAFPDAETEAMLLDEALRKSRRKRRRRRKRKMKSRMASHHAHLVDPIGVSDSYKNLTEDELSRRAKWTIVATACLLLFLCLLLVGITLRMAPIIDEMVRKEEFINAINRHKNISLAASVRKP